ncbi:S1C family serine protease [Collinsella phocaeensis]|uniref:S1C family serine protease n=1 Tax=Collinsella phocaeensis TaxID=1871016 RepID=UPI0009305C50|nr:trypsin-like peptidase domain-containing protein [Collinsella phocaeensis]
MSDYTPQRPDGLEDGAGQPPRVQVESTPQAETRHAPVPPVPQGQGECGRETRTVVKTRAKKLPVFLSALAGLVAGGLLMVALVFTGALDINSDKGSVVSSNAAQQSISIDTEDTTLPEVVSAKALPSVVSITTTIESTGLAMGGSDESSGSIGSGVILDTDGNILTNYHVIEGATDIVVTLDDGTSLEAELVGSDESSDLAVIRVKDASSANLTPIEVGDSDALTVGEWVMAIGSPFGNEQSVSTGIVSALYRSTALPSTSGSSIYANMIQTDAAINPGNSGGALVNDKGELIGINSVIESYSGSSSGVGFAIPVNYAIKIAEQIVDGKTPVHPYLGVSLATVNALNARQNGLSVDAGAYVSDITADGPAAAAGIQKGDIITAVDGDAVASADGLIIELREHEVGDKVTMTVVRGKDEVEVEVELGSDEALQAEQEDVSQDTGNGGLTDEEILRYLQELMGQGQ